MANILEPQFDTEQQREGFTYRRARVGRQAGAVRLGASVYEIPPGEATFPYHWHAANEEMLFVISGRPSVRTEDGWQELEPGDVVAFPGGERGAHQVANHGPGPARVLVVSTMLAPDTVRYPDSGKVMIAERPPGAAGGGDALFAAFRVDEATDYWEGEDPPAAR